MLRAAWALLTVEQRATFFERPEITALKGIPEFGHFRREQRIAARISAAGTAKLPPGGTWTGK
jgi:hypothetical protein